MAYERLNLSDKMTFRAAYVSHLEDGIEEAMSKTADIDASDVRDAANDAALAAVAGLSQMKPEFADSIEGCTDTTKLYVLPDGYIYAYMKDGGSGSLVLGENLLPLAVGDDGEIAFTINEVLYGPGYIDGKYLSGNGTNTGGNLTRVGDDDATFLTGCMPYTNAQASAGVPIYIKGATLDTSNSHVRFCVYPSYDWETYLTPLSGSELTTYMTVEELGDSYYRLTPTSSFVSYWEGVNNDFGAGGFSYMRFSLLGSGEGVVIATEAAESESGTYSWQSTGHAFVPADYEDRILSLEGDVAVMEKILRGDMAVYGIVDDSNDIVTTGTLEAGTYTLKYEKEDGTTIEVGTFAV